MIVAITASCLPLELIRMRTMVQRTIDKDKRDRRKKRDGENQLRP